MQETANRGTGTGSRLDRDARRARHGDLLSREVFTADQRFAVMLAGLAALSLDGDSLVGAFREIVGEGVDPELAEDVLVQMAAYLGYPRAMQALDAFRRVSGRRASGRRASGRRASGRAGDPAELPPAGPALPDRDRYERGASAYAQVNATALATIEAAFGEIAGDLVELTFRSFGDVFATSRQPLAIRQLATVSALAALGGAAPQLRFHIGAALNLGVTPAQLVETIAWVQYLAGMPAAYNALVELKGALAEGSAAPPAYR